MTTALELLIILSERGSCPSPVVDCDRGTWLLSSNSRCVMSMAVQGRRAPGATGGVDHQGEATRNQGAWPTQKEVGRGPHARDPRT
mmetsp:Transcript_91735/g.204861  ORF Transcript_91735/g.204861 Transcript_91735/m.204861 type:complete len:86 (-) Transcript_91735:3-260(-)